MKKRDNQNKMSGELFWSMLALNIVQKFYLFIPGIVLCLLGVWKPELAKIGLILLGVDIIAAVVWMLFAKNRIEHSDSEALGELRGKSIKDMADLISDKIENGPSISSDDADEVDEVDETEEKDNDPTDDNDTND